MFERRFDALKRFVSLLAKRGRIRLDQIRAWLPLNVLGEVLYAAELTVFMITGDGPEL